MAQKTRAAPISERSAVAFDGGRNDPANDYGEKQHAHDLPPVKD
jgi:hypothetical protein